MTRHRQLLHQVPLFQGLEPADLEALEARLVERAIAPGAVVFRKGDDARSMFVLVAGRVRVLIPAADPQTPPVVLQELGTGEFFGEMALLDSQPRSATIDAPAGAELLELTLDDFVAQLMESPRISLSMLAVMSRRLRNAGELLGAPASRDINREIDDRQTRSQKLADRVARWNGSWGFLIVLLCGTAIWTGVNAVPALAFDPYPYQFYNLFLAILVALQGPLLMMSQNRQVAKERLHAEADYQVNLKNETGIQHLVAELAELRRQVEALHRVRPAALPSGAAAADSADAP